MCCNSICFSADCLYSNAAILCLLQVFINDFSQACSKTDVRVAAERSFRRIWQTLLPFISTMKPASDLCFTCQKGIIYVIITFLFLNYAFHFQIDPIKLKCVLVIPEKCVQAYKTDWRNLILKNMMHLFPFQTILIQQVNIMNEGRW